MNLEILQETFAPSQGMDTLDPRWAELSGLVQEGQFSEAAEQAHQLLQEGIYDIRLISYLCFGGFLERGPARLGEVFAGLARVIDGNWEAIGPVKTRAKVTQQSLGWLFKQILKQTQHVEQAKDGQWQAWVDGATSESVEDTLSQAFLLQQAFEPRLQAGAAAVIDPLAKLQAWLRSFAAATQSARAPEPPPATESEAPVGSATTPGAMAPAARVDGAPAGSYHLALLMRKIQALSELLEQQKLVAARIVADDINELMSRFDPLLYFPSL